MARQSSKQREMLLEELKGRCDHPTAENIFLSLKQKIPDVSLGTVYRNLSVLADQGSIMRLEVNGPDRYDGNAASHYHMTCLECGNVTDVDIPYKLDLNTEAERATGAKISSNSIMFEGTCRNCLGN